MRVNKVLLGMAFLILYSVACQASTGKSPEAREPGALAEYDADAVTIAWHIRDQQDFYQIGDGLRVTLIITNENALPISFPRFYFGQEDLGFAPPNAIHLLAPDGEDVLLPYQTLEGLTRHAKLVSVRAKVFLNIYIPGRLRLRQPGTYTLWAELQDNFGTLHHSNQLTFEVVDIAPSIDPALIDFNIRFDQGRYTSAPLWFELSITNHSLQPIVLFEPGNSANPGLPFYDLIVKDAANRWLPTPFTENTCASFCNALNEKDNWLRIEPGDSYQQTLRFLNFTKLLEKMPGEYRVQLSYRMVSYNVCTGEMLDLSHEVFVGHLESNEVQFTLE